MDGERQGRRGGRGLRSARVRDELAQRIEDGRLPSGSQLPSEPELAAELKVSRSTLREALHSLAADGVVQRRRGAGTFVVDQPRMSNSLDLNFGVTAAIRSAGMRPGVAAGSHRVEPATVGDAEKLSVGAGTTLVVIDRVRTADDQPVVVSRDIFAETLLGGRTELLDQMLAGSVYDVLEHELGVDVDYGIATFRPVVAGTELATKLAVPTGELLVYLWQIDYARDHSPVLLSHEYHLAEAFDFSVIRRRHETRLT